MAARSAISFGAFQLFPAERLLRRGDDVVRLGSRAFDILAALAERPGELVGSRELIDKVWPDVFVEEASLRFHIVQLRKALGDGVQGGRYVLNVPGRGYILVEPATRLEVEGAPEPDPVTRSAYALPPSSEHMVGRDEIVRELSEKLRSERFVTIVGPGGVGKTTVALSIANALLRDFAGAVCFVELSSVGDASLLAALVTSALGVPVQAEDPLPELIAHLRGKKILLVLDNCEHVIGKAAEVAERLFVELEHLSILATSREALQVEGEHIFRLPSLASPPEREPLSAAHALAYPAAQLFANRMASAGAIGALSNEEAAIVGSMCRQLAGLPLSIELTAGRAALLGARDTAALLDSLFALHWPGRRTAPPRQQTLSATLDWSYNLLSSAEQAVLRRLSVFSSSFTLDAAQNVALSDDITDGVLFDAIDSLFAKSLLSNDRSEPTTRYRLLDTTRTYARQKLEEAGEREPTRRRHALYYRELLRSPSADEIEPDMPTASNVDLEDIRSALQWAFGDEGDKLLGADIAAYSAPLWLGRALLAEGRAWMVKAAATIDASGATSQQQLRIQIAFASTELFTRGFAETTIAAWDETLERAAALNDVPAQQLAYLVLWGGEIRAAQYAQALATAEKSAALVEGSSDPGSQAMGQWMLGHSKHHTAQFGGAREHLERYLMIDTDAARVAMLKATGYDRLIDAQSLLSNTLWIIGRPEQARAMGKQAVADARSLGFAIPIGVAMSWAMLNTYLSDPDIDVVEHDAVELLEHASTHSIDSDAGFALCLLGLSQARRDDFEAGARLVSKGLSRLASARLEAFSVLVLAHICEAALQAGRIDAAVAWMERLTREDRNQDHWCSSEVLRVQGLLAQAQGEGGFAAEQMLNGVALARRQGALSWELRSTMSLSRLWARQGRTEQALEALLATYGRYSEGFGSRDLIEAKTLIEQLR
ncbi:MAG: transcriptional regulator [Caulobacteraceae bacterium]|nr:transcriptional regulator [Caulobacteraceae bacterium]